MAEIPFRLPKHGKAEDSRQAITGKALLAFLYRRLPCRPVSRGKHVVGHFRVEVVARETVGIFKGVCIPMLKGDDRLEIAAVLALLQATGVRNTIPGREKWVFALRAPQKNASSPSENTSSDNAVVVASPRIYGFGRTGTSWFLPQRGSRLICSAATAAWNFQRSLIAIVWRGKSSRLTLMFGLQQSRPISARPDQAEVSVAPASHRARVSRPM